MAIVKRLVKGAALTHSELDGNFTDLDGRVTTLENTADSDGQTLTLVGTNLTISGGNTVDIASAGLADVVEDTTPQLGGNLDLNGFSITGTGGSSIQESVGVLTIAGTSGVNIRSTGTNNITIGDQGGDVVIGQNGKTVQFVAGSTLDFTGATVSGLTVPMSMDDLTDVDTTTAPPGVGQVLKWDGSQWEPANDSSGTSGIALTDLSVVSASASTSPSLVYNNTTGVFTYTPPDLTQLGANLDLNGNNITGTGNINITGTITSTSAGVPTITSATDIKLQAGTGADDRVEVTQSPLKLANLTTVQRDAKNAENGDIIYNSTTNQTESYENGSWSSLGSSGISLSDLSVTTASAGTAGLAYNNTSGVFTYTPPDLSGYLTSVPAQSFASLTGKPTTLAGYGITDGYANTDVDAHLNTGAATGGQILSWNGSDYAWVADQTGGAVTLNTAGNTGTGSVTLASETLTVTGTTGQINVDAAAFALSLSLDSDINSITSISFEGTTADDFETKLQATDPTADHTINLPNATGNLPLLETSNLFTNDFKVEEAYSATPTRKFFEVETGAGNNRLMRTGINMSGFGQGVAPELDLTSYRSSPADNDAGPEIVFRASTDGSQNSVIGNISSLVYSKTSGAETGEIHIITKVGGSNQGVEFRGRQIKGTGGSLLIDDDLGCTGNVTFDTDLDVGASLKLGMGVEEKFSTTNGATGVTEFSGVNGHVHYLTAPAGNVTANFTNLNGGSLTAEYATNVTVIINQGATARIVSAVQIGGAAQTINWQGNSTPSGTSNGIDAFSFTILNDGGTYVVLGQMVPFGGV